jgi:cytochrome c553
MHLLALALVIAPGLGSAPPALADPAMLGAADPGRVTTKLIKTCAKCHYESGVSDDPEVPHLAGQRASYLYKQLQDFKADRRAGGRMNKLAKRLSDQEMADLVTLYAAKPLPAQPGVEPLPAPALVSDGDSGRGIDACASCHGDDGRGKHDKYDAPALAGMPYDYFVLAMEGFRDGQRANDVDGVMGKASAPLGDDEIAGLADYYLALGQRQRIPPL